ncbi:Transcriptional adapter 1 [Branchiostoma belcheri]|nr:Transcriptional adapter 1 [Branchiostoma belcheri]
MFRTPSARIPEAVLFLLYLSVASTVQANVFARRNVSRIYEFACDHCQLVKLPADIPYKESIRSLSLEWNSITNISNLPYLAKVESVYMSHNLLTTIHWDCFSNSAPSLVHLDLSSNQIAQVSGRIDAHVTPNVTTINLSNNSISSFPEQSFTFSAAKYAVVDVSKNPFRCDSQLCWLWNEVSENEICASPERVEGQVFRGALEDVCGTGNDTETEQSQSATSQPDTNATATVEELTTSYTSTQMASVVATTSAPFTSSFVRAQVTTSALQAGNQLNQNQRYATHLNLGDPQEAMANQDGPTATESYAGARLSQVEARASQDCASQCPRRREHTYTSVKDDANSVRQIVEANCDHHYVNVEGRYERIPNELGCTGVEPYAEIGLSYIAEDTVTEQEGNDPKIQDIFE